VNIEPEWAWLILAALFAIAELVTPGMFLIWLALAAAATGLVTLVTGVAFPAQILLFALFSLGSVLSARKWFASNSVESSDPLLNDRSARLVGRTVTVVAAIENGEGQVRVGDGVWPCRGPDAPVGTRVRVVGADGTCLKVLLERALEQAPPPPAGEESQP
jgi:membrane protein implicated in regulation of membrane protease activity